MLSPAQIEQFRTDGFLLVEDAVEPDQLRAMNAQLGAWIEASRGHDRPFGELHDGRPRFDMAPNHSAARPQLRRVNCPAEASEAFRAVMADSGVTDAVAGLIGPDVQFHHDKINLKLPGGATEVDLHQDFGFTPHSNADLITALVFLDDVTMENGPLLCDPGSHRLGQISLWQDGRFTGTVADEVKAESFPRMASCTGRAGSVCLMHTLVLHASGANRSALARNLYIAVYAAADAAPLAPSPVPSVLQGTIVRGTRPSHVRQTMERIELPAFHKASSFFEVQRAAAGGQGTDRVA